MGSQTEPLGNPFDVGIDDNSGDAEGGSQDHIGGLSADPGKLDQFLHRFWNPAFVCCDKLFTARDNASCLVLIEAGRVDLFFERLWVCFGVVVSGFVFLEEALGHNVDPFISALGREDGGDQKLKRVSVV